MFAFRHLKRCRVQFIAVCLNGECDFLVGKKTRRTPTPVFLLLEIDVTLDAVDELRIGILWTLPCLVPCLDLKPWYLPTVRVPGINQQERCLIANDADVSEVGI